MFDERRSVPKIPPLPTLTDYDRAVHRMMQAGATVEALAEHFGIKVGSMRTAIQRVQDKVRSLRYLGEEP